MYKIIGADSKEYGPASSEQLRQWIAEGRVNAQTLLQAEGQTDWKPLINFPELAPPAAPPPVNPPLIHAEFSVNPSRSPQLRGADKKIAAGICAIILGCLGVHKFILGYTGAGLTMLLITLLTCGIGGVVMSIFGIIEGIIYLSKPDEDFVATYVTGKKGWF